MVRVLTIDGEPMAVVPETVTATMVSAATRAIRASGTIVGCSRNSYSAMLSASPPTGVEAMVEVVLALKKCAAAWPAVLKVLVEYDEAFPYAEQDGDDTAAKAMADAVREAHAILERVTVEGSDA